MNSLLERLGFNTASGVYTAPTDGIYLLSADTRLDGCDGQFFRQVIGINAEEPTNVLKDNGMHMIKGKKAGMSSSYMHTCSLLGRYTPYRKLCVVFQHGGGALG